MLITSSNSESASAMRRLAFLWLVTITVELALFFGPVRGLMGQGPAAGLFEPRQQREARMMDSVARLAGRSPANRVVLPTGDTAFAIAYARRDRMGESRFHPSTLPVLAFMALLAGMALWRSYQLLSRPGPTYSADMTSLCLLLILGVTGC